MSILCSLFAGLMSGLTVGLLSVNMLDLEITLAIGTQEKKKSARRILPLLK
tara:strand:- start:353 stop:505 length:153 start_codon:yes stop_codon:yes gene_type:complete